MCLTSSNGFSGIMSQPKERKMIVYCQSQKINPIFPCGLKMDDSLTEWVELVLE